MTTDSQARTVERILDTIRERRTGDVVPVGAIFHAIYVDPDKQVITPEIEQRAREIQAVIDREAGDSV